MSDDQVSKLILDLLQSHIKEENQEIKNIGEKVDRLQEQLVERVVKTEKKTDLHSWALKIIFSVLTAAGVLGFAGGSLASLFK